MTNTYESVPRHGSVGEYIKCQRIHEIGDTGLLLGLTPEYLWVVWSTNAIVYGGERTLTFFLPWLDIPYSRLRCELDRGLRKCDAPDQVIESFPFQELVIAGLKEDSKDSLSCALDWLGEIPLNQHFVEQVKLSVSRTKRNLLPDRVKHYKKELDLTD